MDLKQEWFHAIDVRTSRRAYLEQKIERETVTQLEALVKRCNAESGLHIQFAENGEELFKSFRSSYGRFHGVQSYFAMVGKKDMPHLREQVGYYGELLVLECTERKLGTCWVGDTYDKAAGQKQLSLSNDEEVVCIITVGKVNEEKKVKEKVMSLMGRKTKAFGSFIEPSTGLPEWVKKGVEAVMKAPSAMNKQPVRFVYQDGTVRASVENMMSYPAIDLGIARLHFELGAFAAGNSGKWVLQNNEILFKGTDA